LPKDTNESDNKNDSKLIPLKKRTPSMQTNTEDVDVDSRIIKRDTLLVTLIN
jgi:hypothetical protein